MNNKLRIALIGAGGFGRFHLQALLELQKRGLVRLVAISDPNRPELCNPENMAPNTPRWFPEYQTMLRECETLDAVTIAAPIPLHLSMTEACIERGLFVYLEKPPVPLIQQLEHLTRCDRYKRVFVGFQMISAKTLGCLKEWIVEGRLGRIKEVRVCGSWPRADEYYERNGWAGRMSVRGEAVFDGPATNAFAHLIHDLMFLCGSSTRFAVPTRLRSEIYRARPIESYDVACVRGVCDTGIQFSAALTHATKELFPYKIKVFGSLGEAELRDDGNALESDFNCMSSRESLQEMMLETYQRFLARIEGRRGGVISTLDDTRGYVLTTNGMLLSSGAIHQIDEMHVKRYEKGGKYGYEVEDLWHGLETFYQTGLLFSELGFPWAKRTQFVDLEDLHHLPFEEGVWTDEAWVQASKRLAEKLSDRRSAVRALEASS